MKRMNKLYYSREDRISELLTEEDRVQYKNLDEDNQRVFDGLDSMDEALGIFTNVIEEYLAVVGQEAATPENIARGRARLVFAWSMMQASVSALAYTLRIDGNDAFQRYVEAVKQDTTPNMAGL